MIVKVRNCTVYLDGKSYYHPDLFKYEGQFIGVDDYSGKQVANIRGIPICVLEEVSVLPREEYGWSEGRFYKSRAKAACDKLKIIREAVERAKRAALHSCSLSHEEEEFLKISWKLSRSLSKKEIWRLMRAILPNSTCPYEDAKDFLTSLPKDGGHL